MRPFIQDFLCKFVAKFEETGIHIDSLILFGSQAKGTAVLSSDVDIAVVMDAPLSSQQRGELRGLGEDIDFRINVDLFFTTRDALNKASGVFDTNKYIRDEGVVLWPR